MSERTKADEAWAKLPLWATANRAAVEATVQAELKSLAARLDALEKRVEELGGMEVLSGDGNNVFTDCVAVFPELPGVETTGSVTARICDPTPAREGIPVVSEADVLETGGVSYTTRFGAMPVGQHPLVRLEDAEREVGERDERIRELEELLASYERTVDRIDTALAQMAAPEDS